MLPLFILEIYNKILNHYMGRLLPVILLSYLQMFIQDCPAGKEPDGTKTACTDCSAGSYSTASDNSCLTCPKGA